MKRKITLLFTAAVCAMQMDAQVLLSESFNAPFTPSVSGWARQNNSVPTSTVLWSQGNPNVFPANSGATNAFYGASYLSQGAGAGTISNWLITPTVSIYNGAIFTFATRTNTGTTIYPDRLQLRMSTAGTSTAVGTGTAGVGTFTTTLLDINPLYSTSTASAVNNGTVNGYPDTWTVYSVTITGQPASVVGRFAFRYFVEDGGASGANSDYIGIDDVNFTAPCGATVPSYTTCASTTTTLNAMGGLSTTTYSWNTGATTSSITVTPSATTVYTLTSFYPGGTCPNPVTSTVTISSNLSINIAASSTSVCAGKSATLTASGANTYSWNTGATTPVIVVTPNTATTYSVGGASGSCIGGNAISIGVNAAPNVTATSNNPMACINQTVTLTGTGATSYTWTQFNVASPTISLGTGTTSGSYTINLTGANAAGCTATTTVVQNVSLCTDIANNTAVATIVSVYPNPFTSELKISGVNGTVQIFNTLGQLVVSTSVKENETINTSNLAKGVYIVKAFDVEGKETKTIRVIKN